MDRWDELATEMVRVMRFPDRSACLCVGKMHANVTTDLADALADAARESIATAIRTAVEAERQRVSGAVRGLVEALPKCSYVASYPGDECGLPATRTAGPCLRCEAHSTNWSIGHDTPYAPALRAVLAMLDGDKRLAASVVADHATTHTAKVERVVEAARKRARFLRDVRNGTLPRNCAANLCTDDDLVDAVDALDGEGGQ